MNWIILIVAGFFESGFAFCLGKMKEVSASVRPILCGRV